jgi:hypothetical protein
MRRQRWVAGSCSLLFLSVKFVGVPHCTDGSMLVVQPCLLLVVFCG